MNLPALANPVRFAALAAAQALEPPPPVDYHAWALENVVFGAESPTPGGYKPDLFPWNRGILEALSPEDPCSIVAVMKAVQVGGTVWAMIFIGGSLDLDPGPCMFVQPGSGNVSAFVKGKWRPFLRHNKRLKKLFPEKSRDAGAALDFQESEDKRGCVYHVTFGSPAGLSQKSIRRQVQDDLDKAVGEGETGDPEEAADRRSEAYRRVGSAKIFKVGNPTLTESSRINRAFLAGTQEHWEIPCPECGALTRLQWDDLRETVEGAYGAAKAGGADDEAAVEAGAAAAKFHCRHCRGDITQSDYRRAKTQGEWVADRPDRKKRQRSFHLWAALVKDWGEIARGWFAAKKSVGTEQTFINEEIGLPYDGDGEAPEWQGLQKRGEAGHDLGVIPPGMDIFVAAADCQGDRVEVQFMAFGEHLRRAVVDYVVIPHHIGSQEARDALDGLLNRPYRNAAGHQRKVELLGIDAGAYFADVQRWVAKHDHHRVWMVRGSKDQHAPDLVDVKRRSERKASRTSTGGSHHVIHWVGSAVIKTQLYGCLSRGLDFMGPDYVAFPTGLPDEYYKMLTAETRVRDRKTGSFFWKKNGDNEALDTAVYAQALAVSLGWKRNPPSRWEDLRRRWGTPPTPQGDLFNGPATGGAATAPEASGKFFDVGKFDAAPAPPRLSALERMAALNRRG